MRGYVQFNKYTHTHLYKPPFLPSTHFSLVLSPGGGMPCHSPTAHPPTPTSQYAYIIVLSEIRTVWDVDLPRSSCLVRTCLGCAYTRLWSDSGDFKGRGRTLTQRTSRRFACFVRMYHRQSMLLARLHCQHRRVLASIDVIIGLQHSRVWPSAQSMLVPGDGGRPSGTMRRFGLPCLE